MKNYWTCPKCGANLDYGEQCECDQENHPDSDNQNFKEDHDYGTDN